MYTETEGVQGDGIFWDGTSNQAFLPEVRAAAGHSYASSIHTIGTSRVSSDRSQRSCGWQLWGYLLSPCCTRSRLGGPSPAPGVFLQTAHTVPLPGRVTPAAQRWAGHPALSLSTSPPSKRQCSPGIIDITESTGPGASFTFSKHLMIQPFQFHQSQAWKLPDGPLLTNSRVPALAMLLLRCPGAGGALWPADSCPGPPPGPLCPHRDLRFASWAKPHSCRGSAGKAGSSNQGLAQAPF